MLVETKAKFLYYKMSRKNRGDVFEMADEDVKDYSSEVQPIQEQPKRGRPRKQNENR